MEELDKLLSFLDVDRERAAEQYEYIRSRLIRLFRARGTISPEDLADETIDRVARRLQAGAKSSGEDKLRYFLGAAHLTYGEHRRREMRQHAIASAVGDSLSEWERQASQGDTRLEALRSALHELPKEQRELLLAYYQGTGRAKSRQELAHRFGIPLNALRIRVYRIRRKLEQRVSELLTTGAPDASESEAVYQSQAAELPVDMPYGEPDFLVIWDPEILSPEEYSELVGALGDLVRASGGLGISRAQPEGYSVPASAVVPV